MVANVAFLLNIFLVTGHRHQGRYRRGSRPLQCHRLVGGVQYLRLDLGGGSDAAQIDFEMETPREFGDYLTFFVLSSTMKASLLDRSVSRKAWYLVRTNVSVDFAFNSVVAAFVSMILPYVM